MELLGVGIPELIFVIIIALIVLGPKDMQSAGKTIGKWLRSIITSDGWKVFQQTSREIRTLPNKLIRDANDEINKIGKEINPILRQAQDNASYLADKGRDVKKPVTPSQPYSPNTRQESQPENKVSSNETESKENESDQPTNA